MSSVEKLFYSIAGKDGHASVRDFVRYFKKDVSGYFNTGTDIGAFDDGFPKGTNNELQAMGKKLGMNLFWLIGGIKGKSDNGTEDVYDGCGLNQVAWEIVARAGAGQGRKSGMNKTRAARLKAIKEGITLDQFVALRNRI